MKANHGNTVGHLLRKRPGILWLLVAGLLLMIGWWVFQAAGPRYQGRTATHWLAVYASRDENEREMAATAFRTMGSNVVPMLITALELPPSRFAIWLNSFGNHFRSFPIDYNQQFNWRRERVCHLLLEIGEPAVTAVPALERASNDGLWYIATTARAALIKMRHEPLTQYIELLKDRSDAIKWYPNAMLLGYSGTNASSAIPLLLESLQDSNGIIQAHALIALGMIRSEPHVCVPAIVPFLTNFDVAIRQKAFFAVLVFKDQAQSARDEIILGLSDADPWIRSQALLACKEILSATDQRRALVQAEALLDDPDPFVRGSAAKLLPTIRANSAKK